MNLASVDVSRHNGDWDREIGALWAGILHQHCVDPAGEIAEIGPGFTLKIGLALKEQQFRGTLYIVEPDTQVSDWVIPRYRDLLPSARIIPVPLRLDLAAAALPKQLDALLMNHLLDDLVLDAVTPDWQRGAIFGSMHQGAAYHNDVRRAWRRLAANSDELITASQMVISDICTLCRQTCPKFLGISQYPSWSQTQNDLQFIDRMTAPLLQQLGPSLRKVVGAPPRFLPHFDREQRWLVLQS